MKQGAIAGGDWTHERLPVPIPVCRAVTLGPEMVVELDVIVPSARKPITSQLTLSITLIAGFGMSGSGVPSAYALAHSATFALA
jgi:hypothetical protein